MLSNKYMGMKKAIDLLNCKLKTCSRPEINRMCMQNIIPAIRNEKNNWEIDSNYIMQQLAWAEDKVNIQLFMNEKIAARYKGDDEKNLRRKIKKLIKPYIVETENTLFTYTTIYKKDNNIVQKMVLDEIDNRNRLSCMVKVTEAAEQLGISEYVLKGLINAEQIQAKFIGGSWNIDQEEVNRFKNKSNRVIGLYDFYIENLSSIPTAFDIENEHDRFMLNRFVVTHDKLGFIANKSWSDFRGNKKNQIYFLSEYAPLFEGVIKKWLIVYGLSTQKIAVNTKHVYWKTHPITQKIFSNYKKTVSSNVAAIVSEVIVNNLQVDITNATMEEVYTLIDYASSEGRKNIYVKSVKEFLYFVKRNYETGWCFNNIVIQKQNNIVYNSSTAPYSQEQYMKLGVLTFNQEVVEKLGLIEKAINNSRYAFLWLWTAWHFLGAWRKGDLKQIPIYKNINKMEIPDLIRSSNSKQYTDILTLWLEKEINTGDMLPFKTAERQKHHYLRVSFAESIRDIIGIIYLIVLYHTTAEKFLDDMPEKFSQIEFRNFFGPEYTAIFSSNPLSNRRLNKNYLDFIAEDIEQNQLQDRKVLGYMVASFARAHVQGNELSSTTSVYLRHQLDGLSSNEICKLLFEEGSFSFVTQYMLKALYGESYDKLPIDKQSLLIKQVNESPGKLERITGLCINAYNNAKKVVDEMFSGDKQLLSNSIKTILSHNAKGKDVGVNCLMLARGNSCKCLSRESCFGCKYAILETHAILILYEKLEEAITNYNNATLDVEKSRINLTISTYLSSLSELLYVAQSVYKLDVKKIEIIVENVLGGGNYARYLEQSNWKYNN